MTRRIAVLLIAVPAAILLAVACGDTSTPVASVDATGEVDTTAEVDTQPYAGWEARPIAALAPGQVEDLLAGRGAGYALAAELNHYPGPTHVLELAGELALTREQKSAIRDTFTAMQREAQSLGENLVALEAELNEAFATNSIDAPRLRELTAAVAQVEGELRNVHLAAHLDVTATLTADQVARYDEFRGYTGTALLDPEKHGGH